VELVSLIKRKSCEGSNEPSFALVTSPPSCQGVFFANGGVTVDAPEPLCFNLAVETEAYIALGSNLGDRELNLLRAVAEIGRLPESRVTALSSFYETSPVGGVIQDAFYNAVLRLSTRLDARSLLTHMLRIEDEIFKRVRTIQQGPRRIDLDLLLYGNRVINEENLVVPHPRLAERRFVLQPLCDIAPDLLHPLTGKSIHELLASLKSAETVVKL
jgi:2-amino-4-hydroxy-6-hydroxymethyldihydropteridine diphosphokinase